MNLIEQSNGVKDLSDAKQQQPASHDRLTVVGTGAISHAGSIESHTVHFDQGFYSSFRADLKNASGLVLIQSPFITIRRIELLRAPIEDCIRRNVRVCVFVQKPIAWVPSDAEQTRLQSHQSARQLLREMGVHVTDFPDIHAKVAVIDEHIAWDGSLNILSQFKTEERMTRWNSRNKVAEIMKSHRLDQCEECCQNAGHCISDRSDVDSFIESQHIGIGAQIVRRRNELGLSQRQLSEISGISQAHIATIEKGLKDVTLSTLARIGRVLKISFRVVPLYMGPKLDGSVGTFAGSAEASDMAQTEGGL